ncbi:MAG: type II toxin-antitoxin system HicA family toxin [Rectinemataceae bacterium]
MWMNSKNRKTLDEIFKNPIPASIQWSDIESLLLSLGAGVSEGNGSRVRILLNGVRAVFHRPHPQKETDRGSVMSVRRFLENSGVSKDGI